MTHMSTTHIFTRSHTSFVKRMATLVHLPCLPCDHRTNLTAAATNSHCQATTQPIREGCHKSYNWRI